MAHFRVVDKLLEGHSDFYDFTRLSDIKPYEEKVKCRAKHRLRSGISFKSSTIMVSYCSMLFLNKTRSWHFL